MELDRYKTALQNNGIDPLALQYSQQPLAITEDTRQKRNESSVKETFK